MEKIQVTPVSQYAAWDDSVSKSLETDVELPTDEINIEKAEEVTKAIEESGITFDDPMGLAPVTLSDKGAALVQQSMSTLKELTNIPEVQKALESEGLTVDYGKVQAILNADDEVISTSGLIRPLTPEEADAVEGGTCACNDCGESTDNDVDTDTMLIVHDLSERLAALEARIALFNSAAHKI